VARKKKEKEVEPLMKKGVWFASFLDILKFGKVKTIRRIFVGRYETAQDAYAARVSFEMADEIKEPPEMLVLELVGIGDYPGCVEEQFIFHWLEAFGDYVDHHGVTRGSYIIRRQAGE
jgi:hypothetical protein